MADRTGTAVLCIGLPLGIMITLLFMNITLEEYTNTALFQYLVVLVFDNVWSTIFAGVVVGGTILTGIRVWNSGFSDPTQNIVWWLSSLSALWALLSVFAWPLIIQIPFWPLIYVILSIIYIFGVLMMTL